MSLAQIKGTNHGAKTLVRVRPRGFCAGVVRAVDIVELALEATGGRSTCTTKSCTTVTWWTSCADAARFSSSRSAKCRSARCWFSARTAFRRACAPKRKSALRVIDATCPLVTKVHLEALKFAREGRTLILIGHRDHQEIVGTSGEAPEQTIVVGQRRGSGSSCKCPIRRVSRF